jgi:hypothetical protein
MDVCGRGIKIFHSQSLSEMIKESVHQVDILPIFSFGINRREKFLKKLVDECRFPLEGFISRGRFFTCECAVLTLSNSCPIPRALR